MRNVLTAPFNPFDDGDVNTTPILLPGVLRLREEGTCPGQTVSASQPESEPAELSLQVLSP